MGCVICKVCVWGVMCVGYVVYVRCVGCVCGVWGVVCVMYGVYWGECLWLGQLLFLCQALRLRARYPGGLSVLPQPGRGQLLLTSSPTSALPSLPGVPVSRWSRAGR